MFTHTNVPVVVATFTQRFFRTYNSSLEVALELKICAILFL